MSGEYEVDDTGQSGSYYSVPPPGGYLDAASYLDGPGTHAYLSYTSPYGSTDTSYAYESDRGGIYRLGTTTYKDGTVSTLASYAYKGSGSTYYRSVDAFSPAKPVHVGSGFGYYYGGPSYTIPNHLESYGYSSFVSETYRAGGYIHAETQNFGITLYTDGSSVSHYYESSQEETYDGHTVPGTVSHYGVAGFNYGDGYPTVYIQG